MYTSQYGSLIRRYIENWSDGNVLSVKSVAFAAISSTICANITAKLSNYFSK